VDKTEPTSIRSELVEALKRDLMGPFDGKASSTEVLELPPSRWYWTGFLAPENSREPPAIEADDELGVSPDEDDEAEGAREPEAKQKKAFAASLGLSVLLPPHTEPDSIQVHVRFATYVREDWASDTGAQKPKAVWKRVAHGPLHVTLALDSAQLREGAMLPNTPKVWLEGELREVSAPGLADGTRVLSLFLVNRRSDAERGREDENILFQVELELEYERGFVPRPNHLGELASERDDRVADLQYRAHHEWAVGHGVAVEVQPSAAEGGRVQRVRTTFFPTSEVRKVVTHDVKGVTLDMDALAQLDDGPALEHALSPMLGEYGDWVAQQRVREVGGPERKQARNELADQSSDALARMRRGIERLRDDAEVRTAFRLANEAMADAARRRNPNEYATHTPQWRLFQLAFLCLCLEDIADEQSPHRDRAELIFFPTGGGKTEAYLGVIAFTLVLRRMRGQRRPDKGLGVAVLLRYTLRLLTLDQLGRAATLICALELLRRRDEALLGAERFAIGLWVGRTATANTLAEVRKAILEYGSSASENATSPFPLALCPACRSPLQRGAVHLEPSAQKAERVVVGCGNLGCAFTSRQGGLPVLFVDEQIYRELPAFVVATVDKFAMLPWRGETGMLFGRVNAREGSRFYGPLDASPKAATRLPEGLFPPELIVQDELHLISGPLGTMVGLYENAIDFLSTRRGAASVRPKVIGSTATIRRAPEQIRALFGRSTCIFPPQGVDASETFFAKVERDAPGRLYMGVAASGRSLKGTLLRTYVALLSAAQKHYDSKADPEQPGDVYMTLAGYFNSLRELGGMRRLVEDEVRTRCLSVEDKRPLNFAGPHPFLKRRDVQMEPVELTSRESTNNVKRAKDRLEQRHRDPKHVDVLLASNMISVGVDIERLGLMVVAGQPKTTSEYIQASSRVGRKRPGLVVTCFNLARPRDRSHYERFDAYHQSFYRFVEAASLTPFSGPALDRGLAGTLVAMARLGCEPLTPPAAAMELAEFRAHADIAAQYLANRAGDQPGEGSENARIERVRARCANLLDSWQSIMRHAREDAAAKRSYSRFDRDKSAGKPLLFTAIDPDQPLIEDSDEAKFQAPTSMRDVEESVRLWVRKSFGGSS
jgi:hypothetical protein